VNTKTTSRHLFVISAGEAHQDHGRPGKVLLLLVVADSGAGSPEVGVLVNGTWDEAPHVLAIAKDVGKHPGE
jgi:hypothetical protein